MKKYLYFLLEKIDKFIQLSTYNQTDSINYCVLLSWNFIQQMQNQKQKNLHQKLDSPVRYPLSQKLVFFKIKIVENQILSTTSAHNSQGYELKDNEAMINQQLSFQVESQFNTNNNRYNEQKITIVIYMNSKNGKVIAGSIKYNLFEKPPGYLIQFNLNLDKCPDKNSKLLFNSTADYIKNNPISGKGFNKSTYSYINDLNHLGTTNPTSKIEKYQLAKSQYITNKMYRRKQHDHSESPIQNNKSKGHKKIELTKYNSKPNIRNIGMLSQKYGSATYLNANQLESKSYPESEIPITIMKKENKYVNRDDHQVTFKLDNSYKKLKLNSFHENSPESRNIEGKSSSRLNYNKAHRVKTYMAQSMPNVQNNEEISNNYIKQRKTFERLKTQLNFRHKEEISNYQNRIQKYKIEIDELNHQLEQLKQDKKVNERKQKNIQFEVKQLKQLNQQLRLQQLKMQEKLQQFNDIVNTKQKQIKEMLSIRKNQEEKFDKQRTDLKIEDKKLEYKNNILTEQLKKLEEKYKQSEKQRNQSKIDYNNMLNRMEEDEKKQQLMQRDKQKLFIEEKVKLSKNIQNLNGKLKDLQQKLSDSENQTIVISAKEKQLLKVINKRDITIMAYENDISELNHKLNKSNDLNENLKRQIQQFKLIEQEKNTLKKKVIEYEHEKSTLKEKLLRNQSNYQILEDQLRGVEEKYSKLTEEYKSSTHRNNNLKKQLDQEKHCSIRLSKDRQSLTIEISALNKKNQESSRKFFQQKSNLETIVQDQETQIQFFQKIKNGLEKQIKQSHHELTKLKQYIQQLQIRYKQQNGQILQLNQQSIQLNEKLRNRQNIINDLQRQLDIFKYEKTGNEAKNRQLNHGLNEKDNQIYQFKKFKQNIEEDLYVTKSKLSQLQIKYKEKLESTEKQNKQHGTLMTAKNQEIFLKQGKINVLADELNQLKQLNSLLKKQHQHYKSQISEFKQQCSDSQNKLFILRKQKQQSDQNVSNLKNKIFINENELETLKREKQKLKEEFESYREAIFESFNSLLNEINRQEQKMVNTNINVKSISTNTTLKGHIEPRLSKIQYQIIQKRNTVLMKNRTKVFEMEVEINGLQTELQKFKSLYGNLQKQYEFYVNKEKEKFKKYEINFADEKEGLMRQIGLMEKTNLQQACQIQRLNIEVKKYYEIIQEQRKQIPEFIAEIEENKRQKKQLQSKLYQLKQSQIKQNINQENNIAQLEQTYEAIIGRLRQEAIVHEKKIFEFESIVSQKQDQIKKLEGLINEKNFEKQKLDNQRISGLNKIEELSSINRDLERRLKQQQKKLKKLIEQNNKQGLQTELINLKLQEHLLAKKKLQQQIIDEQIIKKRLLNEIEEWKIKYNEILHKNKETQKTYQLTINKQISQITNLNNEKISLKSQISLKQYIVSQNLQNIKTNKTIQESLYEQLSKKKQIIEEKHNQIDQINKKWKQIQQQRSELLQQQKRQFKHIIDSKQRIIDQLKSQMNKLALVLQSQIQHKTQEYTRISNQQQSIIKQKQNEIIKLNMKIKQIKSQKDMININLDDMIRKSNKLQLLLDDKHKTKNNSIEYDRSTISCHIDHQQQRQKVTKMMQHINELQRQRDNIIQQYKFEKQQLMKQLQDLTNEYNQLIDKLNDYEENKAKMEEQIESKDKKILQLKRKN